MSTAVEVGVGYVSVVPSARGFAEALQQQIGRPTVQVGAEVGEQAGEATGRGMLGSIGGVLKAGLGAVAIGGAALFTAAFVGAVEQDKSNKRLAAALGLGPKEAERVGKLAGGIYAKGYGQSIDEVNTALKQLSQNGVVAITAPKKEVEGLTKSALNLADAFGADVGAAARAAGQLVKTGLAADSKSAFDLITRGFQSGADKSEDFLDTLNEYSTQFRDLGLNGAQAVGLLTQGLKAGARDGDIVADALKEFAIRAKDGSDTSAAGFKAIGLNAAAMTATFAKGGPAAATALDQVLDRLRAVQDPAKRSQTAVALFGTQAEDLQQSLFALDPSKATSTLGAVGGAADKMGKTLHSGAGASFEVFQRQILQGLVNFINVHVLPAVMEFGSFLNRYILPAAQTVGGALAAVLVPAVTTVAGAFMAGVRWVREYGAWLLPLGVAVLGLTITMNASAIATAAVTAVFSIYRGVLLAAAAVTRGYAIAQGFLNAVMNANPIGLIITGIAALVTLFVVAYNKSDTFRGIVQATWAGIQAGWNILWNDYLKPGFDLLMVGLKAIGQWASWLWSSILSPVFGYIGTAAKVLFAVVMVVLITPWILAFKFWAAVIGWLWSSVLKPVFQMIGALATWLWGAVIKPVFGFIMAYWRAWAAVIMWLWGSVLKPVFGFIGALAVWLYQSVIKPVVAAVLVAIRAAGAVFTWLWTNAVKPAFGFIGALASWLWASVIKPVFGFIMTLIRGVGSVFSWLWTNAVKPAFNSIGSLVGWLWDKLKAAFDKGKQGVALFGAAFEIAKKAIGKAWDQVSNIAKKPINFIIEWVYNKGIKAVWDKVAGFVGLGKLPAGPKLLQAGGTVGNGWGPATPMKVSRPTAIVGEGNPAHPEYVIPTDPRYRGRALSLWQAAGTQLMADGGIIGGAIDWVGDKAKSIGGAVMNGVDFLSDPTVMWEKATKFVRDKIAEIGRSQMAQMVGKIPMKMLAGLKNKVVSAATSFFGGDDGGGGGGSWARPVSAGLGTRYGVRGNMWSSGYHTGTDFPAATGTAVRAAAAGIVQSALSGGPYGNHITLRHGGGLTSLYAHLSSTAVRAGQTVSRGARIGAVGATGNTTGPHLHFEARRNGSTINPEPFLGYANGGRPRAGEIAWVGERGPELVRFGAGGATVWDHRTSMNMAAGMDIGGYARGTTGARGEVVAEIKLFTRSLTGSAGAIAKATQALTGDLRRFGAAGSRLVPALSATSTRLQQMAAQRDGIAARITAARTAAGDQRKVAQDYLGLSQIGDVRSVEGLLVQMKNRQTSLTRFQSAIAKLSARGVDKGLISQLIAEGADSPLAGLVAGAGTAQLRQLNSLAASGVKLSASYGMVMADSMFDAGSNAGKGFLTGLLGQQKALQDAMNKLAAGMVATIKAKLKINSPSRVTEEVGEQTGAGVGVGLDRMGGMVSAAASRIAAASVPSPAQATLPPPRIASSAGGLAAGSRLRLVVGDREFDAYVEEIADGRIENTLTPVAAAIAGRRS
ncbi:peptidoglycan DD-metalloendopeptidase family protein [Streptomyces sp. NPDC005953]|uniref:peptidoglycan DD-metalloendopeptidase family protein n=1 Tax=Streptomyces sp. NPDC005953 TaxID=3156719 RepID=UPI0033FAC0C4